MTDDAAWEPLGDELARWRRAGRQPRFWLRDDDAVVPTRQLDRLLDVTRPHGVPVAIAVIPAHTGEALAQRLSGETHAAVAVHGWAHANHAGAGEKKQELGPHRTTEAVLAELAAGLAHLARLHGPRLQAVLVPPWNRIDPGLLPHLSGLGFRALSVFGRPFAAAVPVVNSTVDIIDWHATRGCRDQAVLVGEIVAQLRTNFDTPASSSIGILAHHLVHDEAAWLFLERLFAMTTAKGASWPSLGQLLEARAR